jgi:hypothetical protein
VRYYLRKTPISAALKVMLYRNPWAFTEVSPSLAETYHGGKAKAISNAAEGHNRTVNA